LSRYVTAALMTLMLFVLGCSSYKPSGESIADVVRRGNPPVNKQDTYEQQAVLQRSLGEKYYSEDRYHLAIEEFSGAVEMSPGDVSAYEGLGRSYREIGEFDRAIEALNKGLALITTSSVSPIGARLHNTKAVTYDMMGRYEESLVEYENATKQDPTNDSYYNNMGFSYLLQGQTDKAISAFKKALEINPANKTTYTNLGYAYGSKGMYELALKNFKIAIDEASAYNNMGYIYAEHGKLTDAIESYNNALKINPKQHTTYYNKGMAYELLGDIGNAIQAYQEFIKQTTDVSAAEDAFNRIHALKKQS